jgi:hypothetical protein
MIELSIARFDRVIPVYSTIDEAMAAVAAQDRPVA